MSDFSDKPLVAGSLTGMRAFSIDRYGRLISPQRPTIFTPGENVAECKRADEVNWTQIQRQATRTLSQSLWYIDPRGPSSMSRTAPLDPDPEPELKPEPPKHTAGILDCSCGWYAYFDGSNDYKEPDRITALIEGYGVCTLGTRGFRAQKARVVAIVAPGKRSPIPADRVARVVANYPDVPVYARKSLALEAHPLTPPALPTPETHPDFWTMEVGR